MKPLQKPYENYATEVLLDLLAEADERLEAFPKPRPPGASAEFWSIVAIRLQIKDELDRSERKRAGM